ncbi:hypothetical protein Lal_00031845 [Lupinus albus]|nr:hypothetical protein Lal_00031845 [Lupinus albus]
MARLRENYATFQFFHSNVLAWARILAQARISQLVQISLSLKRPLPFLSEVPGRLILEHRVSHLFEVYVVMDKTWISKPHNTFDYLIGLSQFLDFAFENGAVGDTIRCPCPKCGFMKWKTRDISYDHLLRKPFPLNYVIWNHHDEKQLELGFSPRLEGGLSILPDSRPSEKSAPERELSSVKCEKVTKFSPKRAVLARARALEL